MASLPLCRAAFRRNAFPLGVGVASGLVLIHRQQPMRFDAVASTPLATHRAYSEGPHRKERLNPEIIKQLSSGSLSGFLTGLVISVFSKTLVLLIGTAIVFIQVAKRYGIDLVEQLRLRRLMNSSRILGMLNQRPAFKIAFGITFALSAFMSF